MSLVDVGMVLAAVATAASGQVLLRYGMRAAASPGAGSLVARAATSPPVLGGLAVFGVSAVLWLWALSRVPLSVAYPFNGLSFVAVLVASHVLLGEELHALSIVGFLLVAAGIACVALTG